METLFKRYYTKLQYFVGTIMNVKDLERIQVKLFSTEFNRFYKYLLRLIKHHHV